MYKSRLSLNIELLIHHNDTLRYGAVSFRKTESDAASQSVKYQLGMSFGGNDNSEAIISAVD